MNKVSFRTHLPLLLLLAGLLVVGILIADDYGITVDDIGLWDYGRHVVLLYREASYGKFSFSPGPDNLPFYGPAFLTVVTLAEETFLRILPHLDKAGVWHLFVFMSFLASAAGLYYIGRWLFQPSVAFGATLLYIGQPVLWGHAFINAKDAPFLSFFVISIAAGFFMDRAIPDLKVATDKLPRILPIFKSELAGLQRAVKTKYAVACAILLVITAYQLNFPYWAKPIVDGSLGFAANNPESWLGSVFHSLASNLAQIPLENYIEKALIWVNSGLLLLISLVWILLIFTSVHNLPKTRKAIKAWLEQIPWETVPQLVKSPAVWLAGFLLGFTWAIRVVAPFAGLLVAIFLIARKKFAAVPALLIYMIIAALGTYLLWPFLWPAPVEHLISSLTMMANFPQDHTQQFNGQTYSASTLPFYFLPQMFAIQLTLPVILLLLVGCYILFHKKGTWSKPAMFVPLLWLGLPLAYCILFKPNMYNNFRQWLFITPPLFLIAGVAMHEAQKLFRRQWVYWLFIVLLLSPGIVGIIQLHPYQYIYYNALVGGIRGADERFELDYWETAMKEASLELNNIAPPNSRVVVWYAIAETAGYVARPDLIIERNQGGTFNVETGYHYAIIRLRSGRGDDRLYPEAPIVITVTKAGVPLTIVKKLNCSCDLTHE
ncbi:MAG: hypothetical protein KIS85_01350 [Anaerolineales bacterium]|nr:hypothetical protein [Anaerolineales bacterium]